MLLNKISAQKPWILQELQATKQPSNNPNMVLIPTFFQPWLVVAPCCCGNSHETVVGINGISTGTSPNQKCHGFHGTFGGPPGPPKLSHCEFGKPLPKFLKKPPQLVVIPAKKVASARVLGLDLVRSLNHISFLSYRYLLSLLTIGG